MNEQLAPEIKFVLNYFASKQREEIAQAEFDNSTQIRLCYFNLAKTILGNKQKGENKCLYK